MSKQAVLREAVFHASCEKLNSFCNTLTGVWYLCLAIIVLLILISWNDILMSRCYFLGFPWSKTKVYVIYENDADDQCQLFAALDNSNQLLGEEFRQPPPPPYSMMEATLLSDSQLPLL
ncbi:Transcription factor tau 95 kDa subunit [Frankliniella fusca]|uniref:Transcription factor tau 95 kDa subunit n=1 Tax=Frankliniella fusca TaxID=407009 RepID=A0AAE1H0Y3_9NEOP|nr:Transcription factor tau 95 kDa subunit [Frankliniella fusca]